MTMMQAATARTSERNAFYDRNGGFNKAALWDQLHGSVTARPGSSDRKFRRYLKTLGLITMVGVSANLAMPMGKAQARGDFSLTCDNIRLDAPVFTPSAILRAHCVRRDKTPNLKAEIQLNNLIANNHGKLQWATHGDFEETCLNTGIQSGPSPNDLKEHLLVATCLIPFNDPNKSTLDLNEHIANNNGNLMFVP
jgi:hypothetical protein